jgi:hypothetical protein
MLVRPYNPTFPATFAQECSDPNAPETYDYGFNRRVPFLQSPPVGAGILSIIFFFLIVFFSNILLAQVSLTTLGIAVTLGTFGLLTLVVLVLFLL